MQSVEENCRTKIDRKGDIPKQMAQLMDRLYSLFSEEESGSVLFTSLESSFSFRNTSFCPL